MNLHALTTIIRKADNSISANQGNAIVEALFDGIAAALARGEEVRITRFGVFWVAERAARKGRNPRTGETVTIAAKKRPAFRPSLALREAVNPQRKVGGARNSPMRRAG